MEWDGMDRGGVKWCRMAWDGSNDVGWDRMGWGGI